MVCISRTKSEKCIDEIVGVFSKPLIVYPGGWHDTLPDWIKSEIKVQRMVQLMAQYKNQTEGGRATDVEALAYLYTANLVAPLPHDYAEIFFYLTGQAMHNKPDLPDFLQDYQALDSYKESLLDGLKRDIWHSQEMAYKSQMKSERSYEPSGYQGPAVEQLKLF